MSSARRIVRSSCRGCHGVCQVLVHMEGERVVKVTGDAESPTSRGFLCPKGAAAPEVLYHPDRLTQPLRRAGRRLGVGGITIHTSENEGPAFRRHRPRCGERSARMVVSGR